MRKGLYWLFIMAVILGMVVNIRPPLKAAAKTPPASSNQPFKLADYSGFIREAQPRADGIRHVDTPAMIEKLKVLNVNTYYYLLWYQPTDWDDFKDEFLPAAKDAGINVVLYLVPPSESTGSRKSYPYTTDYVAWARAIAELSLKYPNLIGWSIDDFNQNLDTFTPEYMAQMREASKIINPNLWFMPSFMPVMYFPALTEDFMQTRGDYIDGVIIAYRDDPYRNTSIWSTEQEQIDAAYNVLKPYHMPLIWMVYTSYLTSTPSNPSVKYVRETVQTAAKNLRTGKLAGVITYELEKEFVQELADHKAFNGDGYMSFFVPAAVRTSAGNSVSASQIIHPDGSGKYELSFRTMAEGPKLAGYHFRQVLVDDQVVWEQDVAQNPVNGQWDNVKLDLTPYLKGKKWAKLTIRLYEKNGVTNYWDNVGFDRFEPNGFTLENGDFEWKGGWDISSNYHGMIGEILIYDPNRRQKAFEAVEAAYVSSALYDEVARSNLNIGIRQSLLVQADKAIDAYFAEYNQTAILMLHALSNEIHALAGRQIPRKTAESWIDKIERLKQLYRLKLE
ncbi:MULTISPECIES: hypothetical protein [Thermoactinomyces]|jgi:hypothetical protein|uniref:Uncharacterized protein n=1 Tax=Thermoactinomyces daqus TaxID=1329516 RepID=A0A7W1X911_9BACL|nr:MULTISPECIES: hypothetical protein [Thermoactinomyces]MBA4542199.1 hypothetical protein [Thermoactinomyces daqus]MBH8598350.1 hypothetical protein [Thermoactinomyces sp. CICC 10523]MBH8604474.1 hypothetical protein [Thermoactinomyces sp. CICC 10522]MBH8607525.1 hypothetical protein [Thermoactinomyces sp. CICC 10521]